MSEQTTVIDIQHTTDTQHTINPEQNTWLFVTSTFMKLFIIEVIDRFHSGEHFTTYEICRDVNISEDEYRLKKYILISNLNVNQLDHLHKMTEYFLDEKNHKILPYMDDHLKKLKSTMTLDDFVSEIDIYCPVTDGTQQLTFSDIHDFFQYCINVSVGLHEEGHNHKLMLFIEGASKYFSQNMANTFFDTELINTLKNDHDKIKNKHFRNNALLVATGTIFAIGLISVGYKLGFKWKK